MLYNIPISVTNWLVATSFTYYMRTIAKNSNNDDIIYSPTLLRQQLLHRYQIPSTIMSFNNIRIVLYNQMMILLSVQLLLSLLVLPPNRIRGVSCFIPRPTTTIYQQLQHTRKNVHSTRNTAIIGERAMTVSPSTTIIMMTTSNDSSDDENEASTPPINPYADPNYPDLEFVNYDDPEYSIDRSLDVEGDETITDETLLEQMREERRVSNDEYQYNTYYHTVWNAGTSTYRGEWTIYYSSTFFPQFDDDTTDGNNNDNSNNDIALPRLIQVSDAPVTVISRAVLEKSIDTTNQGTSSSYITHIETLDEGMGDVDLAMAGGADEMEQQVVSQTYWPEQLMQTDFRGHQGIMICGNAYTICTSVPLNETPNQNDLEEDWDILGPFREHRVELGICADDEARFRIKLDYSILPSDLSNAAITNDVSSTAAPSLHLKTMVVCREAADKWPRSSTMARSLFGTPAGAPGGLYDPPPIGSFERSENYCLVDLDGSATALIPIIIDQFDSSDESDIDNTADGNSDDDRLGWVTSLDWTAGAMRYQVDRKVHSGRRIRGLRTLELSEVQGVDADRYRPRDNGQNLRQ